jgi:hypothetical protein
MTSKELNKDRVRIILETLPSLIGQRPQLDLAEESVKGLLADYFRLVEIAHYVRRGGVKAMIYRLETGKTGFIEADYFDEAHERLISAYGQLYSAAQAKDRSLLERLHEFTADEEEAVKAILPELEDILLQDKRLEAVLSDEQ